MISEQQFIDSAKQLNIDVAALKAVAKIEGGGTGLIDGKPVILFEPHIFYRLLDKAGLNPVISEICYPKWGTKPYPFGQAAKWAMLDKAIQINGEIALKIGIMGNVSNPRDEPQICRMRNGAGICKLHV